MLTSLYVDFSDAQGQLTPESVVESRHNSKSSLLLWLSLLPSRMKIQSKIKALEWTRHFSHYTSIELYFRRSRAANSVICNMWSNRAEIQKSPRFYGFLTCKSDENQIKNEGVIVLTRLYIIFRCSRAVNSAVSGDIPLIFALIQAFMVVLISSRMKRIQ